MKMQAKKGAEKILSIYWFVILGLVASAVVWMVSIFYEPHDVRQIEVGLLADKAADCVSRGGYLREGILIPGSGFQESFLDRCGINLGNEEEQYFLKLEFYDFDQTSNPLLAVSAGDINLRYYCELKGENSPVCLERELYTIDKEGKSYMVKIFSIIGKMKENV